jgi:hypothetical protein
MSTSRGCGPLPPPPEVKSDGAVEGQKGRAGAPRGISVYGRAVWVPLEKSVGEGV